MNHATRHLLAVALMGTALAGCGKSGNLADPLSSNSTTADEAAVTTALAQVPGLVDEDVFSTTDETSIGAGQGLAAINPLRFWRTIERIDRRFAFQFSDPDSNGNPQTAFVTIHRHHLGHFNIVAGDPATSPTDSTRQLIRKPLDDRWVRRIALRRVRINPDSSRSVWRVVGTSGAVATSEGATSAIKSLRIQAGSVDTTVTDPLELHRLRRILKLDPNTLVNLTLTTGNASDVALLYRLGHRIRMTSNGDGTFSAEFNTSNFGGLRHLGVNALSNGTLYDDQAPYDSKAWVIPFAVLPLDVLAMN